MTADRDVYVTGIGLVSTAGVGWAHHPAKIASDGERQGGSRLEVVKAAVSADRSAVLRRCVHALAAVDVTAQIPSKSEQRQMGLWQRIGVHAAGLALEDAGLKGHTDALDRTDIVVAAGNGERDLALDERILEGLSSRLDRGAFLNASLAGGLRPTLYLGELSNLLAGNIQIVHKVTGSSRTLKGEEISGVSAIENASRRIWAGQGDIFLVGGALNAERADLLLGYELGGNLWSHPYASVWERHGVGGGFVPGSAGAFLVLEARGHAEARGARAYARVRAVSSARAPRASPDEIRASLSTQFDLVSADLAQGPLAVLSGASGVDPATAEELEFLQGLEGEGYRASIRAYGSRLGHTVEAHFPLGVALAALSLASGRFYAPFDGSGVERGYDGAPDRILVTGVGHWRGEGLALIESVATAREVV